MPLWDLPWEICDKDREAAIERSRRLARRLLRRGWAIIEVLHRATHVPRDITLNEALVVVTRDEPWQPSDEMFSLVATDAGRDAYGRHSARRPLHRVGFNY